MPATLFRWVMKATSSLKAAVVSQSAMPGIPGQTATNTGTITVADGLLEFIAVAVVKHDNATPGLIQVDRPIHLN